MVKKTIFYHHFRENMFGTCFTHPSQSKSKVSEETNQILAPKVENPTENDEDAEGEDEDEIEKNEKKNQVNSKREKPRLSKKARKQMKEGTSVTRGSGEDDDFDIKVSGEAKRETAGANDRYMAFFRVESDGSWIGFVGVFFKDISIYTWERLEMEPKNHHF